MTHVGEVGVGGRCRVFNRWDHDPAALLRGTMRHPLHDTRPRPAVSARPRTASASPAPPAVAILPGSTHEQLSSQLEQQVRTIATCFKLKTPRSGFSPSEWLVLSALVRGMCNLKELAQQTALTISSTRQVIRRLALLGLIAWQRSERDRRHYALAITPQGRTLHAQTRERAVRDNAACFAGLSVAELRIITQLLGKCVADTRDEPALDRPDPSPRPTLPPPRLTLGPGRRTACDGEQE